MRRIETKKFFSERNRIPFTYCEINPKSAQTQKIKLNSNE